MSRAWFAQDLETVATWWRILRRDGVTLGFVSHNRDLWFDGVLHRAAPGMVPSAIRRSAGLDQDSAEVAGALSHDAVNGADLAAGRYDGARVRIGLVDWQTLERETIWVGTLSAVGEEDGRFTAELASRKVELSRSVVPRTSPACRAVFCGPGCDLNPGFFTHEGTLTDYDADRGWARIACDVAVGKLSGGTLRFMDSFVAGATVRIDAGLEADAVLLDPAPEDELPSGVRVVLREGCDHRLDTCASRFGNAANFRGEPFLPGNDLLTRTGSSAS
jgi:uncharacterized phage protein (TIGR02218 family)